MAYTYCVNCDESLNEPTVRQVLDDFWACPHCGYEQQVDDLEYRSAIIELLDRIEYLEEKLK